jgi:tetratricopeptide (TPR) repeat protein
MTRATTALASLLLAGFAAFAAFALPAAADQDDPRLDDLFARLHTVEAAINARGITNAIWLIWMEHEDPRVEERMVSGVQAMQREDYWLALAIYDDLIDRVPDYAEAWNKRATVHYLLGNYELSLEDIERTLDLEPRHFGALEGRGLIYGELGQVEDEVRAYERALELNPHLPAANRKLEEIRGKSERI